MNDQYLNNWNDAGPYIQGGVITTTTGDGIWCQLNNSTTISDPLGDKILELEKQIELVRLDNKLLRLKMLSMEGKFTAEEVTNIRKMLMSNDKASKTLADSIIENA